MDEELDNIVGLKPLSQQGETSDSGVESSFSDDDLDGIIGLKPVNQREQVKPLQEHAPTIQEKSQQDPLGLRAYFESQAPPAKIIRSIKNFFDPAKQRAKTESDDVGSPFKRGVFQSLIPGLSSAVQSLIPDPIKLERSDSGFKDVSSGKESTPQFNMLENIKQWSRSKLSEEDLAKGKYSKPPDNFFDFIDLNQAYSTLGESIPAFAAQLGVAFTSKGGSAATALMAAMSSGNAEESMREHERATGETINSNYKRIAPIALGVFNAALEKAGLDNIINKSYRSRMMGVLMTGPAEGITETGERVADILVELGYNPDAAENIGSDLMGSFYAGVMLGSGAKAVLPSNKGDGESIVSGQDVETSPSEAQKESGNYKKGHVEVDGLDITIENPVGSTRSGKDDNGKEWKQKIVHDYGYIKGTKGKDKDQVDIFINSGSNPSDVSASPVFIVDQVDPDGKFDEHKVMLGFDSKDAAEKGYLDNYEKGWRGLGEITEIPYSDFKDWVRSESPSKGAYSPAISGAGMVDKPVDGTGKKRESRVFQKVNKLLKGELGDNPKYNQLRIEDDAKAAVGLVENDYEKALSIARGESDAPANMSRSNIAAAVAEKAIQDKDLGLAAEITTKRSLELTRAGQEIVTERGRVDENAATTFVKQVIKRRLKKASQRSKSNDKDLLKSVKERAKKEQKEVDKKAAKIANAQKIIDSLKC